MKTLYDLLGALREDDAEGLRAAFRRAAKASHPDIHADDPEAPLRFRQMLCAKDILGDARQRVAYDLLLELALEEPAPNPLLNTTVDTIRKLAFDVITVATLSIVSIGGYLLFDRLSKASVPTAVLEVTAHAPADNVAVAPTPQFDTTSRDGSPDKPDGKGVAGAGVTDEAIVPSTVAPEASAASTQANADVDPTAGLAVKDAKSYWQRGIAAYRGGEVSRAVADFDHAIQLDPVFADAYIDRGIALYRLNEFGGAHSPTSPG
jgi:curved DNA-binding protein CbpA